MAKPMARVLLLGSVVLLLGCRLAGRGWSQEPTAEGYKAGPGPYEVAVLLVNWHDDARDRDVPAKLYYPTTGDGPFPVIIFSHGLGGTREGYSYLGNHWASHGYVSVHVQHKGSDDSVWRGSPDPMGASRRAAADPGNMVNRPRDISFAIDRMERMNGEESPLQGRLDLEHVAVAGHSFGAYTTLAAAGEVFTLPGGRQVALGDPRVKAAIPMSAPVPNKRGDLDAAFGKIVIPCFHMTGTKDDSPIGETTAAERRLPFDHSNASDQFLITFAGGDHMIFSGRPRALGEGARDAVFQNVIKQATVAFWDCYLRGSAEARTWLTDGGLKATLGADGVPEMKLLDR